MFITLSQNFNAKRPMNSLQAAIKHSHLDDIQAITIGTLIIAFGINIYSHAGLLLGGTAGLSFLAEYGSPLSFGQAFFLVNLPFYWLALKHIGREYTLKTFISVLMLSLFSDLTPMLIKFELFNIFYAAILGGLLIGTGMLMLFRHNAGLGGFNILARYLAKKYAISIGKFQMFMDCCVVFLAAFIVEWPLIVVSVIGAIALNFIIAVNHKPGRYSAI